MKETYLIIIITTILIFSSCEKKEQTERTPEEILTDTPEVLDENSSDYKWSSKRYNTDIISKLYTEALEKNNVLKSLDEDIHNMNSDSLNVHTKSYIKFSNTNDNFWANANQHIGYLNDSILKQETAALFKNLELNYRESIAKHENKLKKIREQSTLLNDKLVLMKLMISQSMMKNYQVNEKPDIQELETLLKQYDALIKKTDEFTKIRK